VVLPRVLPLLAANCRYLLLIAVNCFLLLFDCLWLRIARMARNA
jgi:hypothetical protein